MGTEQIIPCQDGTFKNRTEWSQDIGIDGELKDIGESLGLAIRGALLDLRVELEEFIELEERTQDEVLLDVLQRFKGRAKTFDAGPVPERPLAPRPRPALVAGAAASNSDPKQSAQSRETFYCVAVRLFVWLVHNEETDRLDGFPVLSRTASAEHAALITLVDDDGKFDDRPLAPVTCWPEPAQVVAELFPRRYTLADKYHEALPEVSAWEMLAVEAAADRGAQPCLFAARVWVD